MTDFIAIDAKLLENGVSGNLPAIQPLRKQFTEIGTLGELV
jgi:hypothetical protein